ncbi:hypothetical protein AOQ84DRAFT_210088 [Glonium stellatum]|uniref:Uncharacterized protein n=1 Tax=Glonium stellatum TaxID=574774 RepID=A0A8E2F5W2_9PEZI|nr:hypothetical protein AOQ84DRAFT_210088 [Glonium stellatum]
MLMARNGSSLSFDSLNDDVLLEICSFVQLIPDKVADPYDRCSESPMGSGMISASKSLSLVNKHLRALVAIKMFRRLSVAGWNAFDSLDVIGDGIMVVKYARLFKISILESQYKPPPDFFYRLAGALTRMKKLELLSLRLAECQTKNLAEAFEKTNLSLPCVQTLVVDNFCDFIIKHCPNVRTISARRCEYHQLRPHHHVGELCSYSVNLIIAAGQAPHLTHFEMYERWQAKLIEEVHEHMPNLKHLGMPGGCYKDRIQVIAQVLSRFKILEELVLKDTCCPNFHCHLGQWSRLRRLPRVAERTKQANKLADEARDKIARLIIQACPGIKSLWIGWQDRAEFVKDETDYASIVWEKRTRVRIGE